MIKKSPFFWSLFLLPLLLLLGSQAFAQVTLPTVNLGFKTSDNPTEVVSAVKLVLIMTVLTLAPAILIMMTGFTRILTVLSFVRQAIGVQQMPPNQMLVGLSLFLLRCYQPFFTRDTNASRLLAGTISQEKRLMRLSILESSCQQTRGDWLCSLSFLVENLDSG